MVFDEFDIIIIIIIRYVNVKVIIVVFDEFDIIIIIIIRYVKVKVIIVVFDEFDIISPGTDDVPNIVKLNIISVIKG